MLLAIDIGNSNISVGLFDQKRDLKFLSSIDTDSRKTADQISIDLMNIFSLYQYDLRDVSGAIFSSVVPPINSTTSWGRTWWQAPWPPWTSTPPPSS